MRNYPPAILDRKIRSALVGCGRIASKHSGAIRQHRERCELAGVCDVDRFALAAAADKSGAEAYTSLDDMLARCDADAFILTTPSGLHPEQAVRIARAGRHIITEKPMATRREDGKRMVAAADTAGVRLFVAKQNRRNATLHLLKSAVEKKRFGRTYMVNLNVFRTRPDAYQNSARWRGTWECDGGAFMNQASHYVDLIDRIVGPVDSLHACTATLARNIELEDTGVISLRWRNGALGSMNVTMLTCPRKMEGSITILGGHAGFASPRVGGISATGRKPSCPRDSLALPENSQAPATE